MITVDDFFKQVFAATFRSDTKVNFMRHAAILIAAALSASTPAQSATPNEQACILKAAETPPRVAGMKIGKSRTKPLETPAGWQGSGPPIRVEVDWTAAGQAATWVYLCAVGEGGGAIVQRLTQ